MAGFSRIRPLAFALLAVLLAGSAAALGVQVLANKRTPRPSTAGALVYVVPVTGVIELGLAPFIARSIREASAADARAVILDIETPGGRVDAAEQIVDAVKDAPIPVYAFVNRRAFSAGALISLATDSIYIRPGGVIGAATPVTGEGEKAPEKIVSAMRSEMRALAEDRGLDPRIAEAMVDEDVEIDGAITKEKGKLLTLTAEEAAVVGYARIVEDFDALLEHVGLSGATIVRTETNWAESVVRFLTHPLVAPMLLSLGFLGVIIELKTPAFGLAGALGVGSLGLFFGSHYIIGLAGLEELILLAAGLVLIAVEIFVIPGFGIAGVLGILALGSSVYLSLVSHWSTAAELGQAAGVLSLAGIIVILAAWALIRSLPRSGRFARSGLLLGESTSRETGYLSADLRSELVGATGVAITDLRPAGAARFGEERVDVVADSNWISAGTPVRIVRSDGYRHVVQVVEPPA
jgi:membrane-bound serine protease (ClpP class)